MGQNPETSLKLDCYVMVILIVHSKSVILIIWSLPLEYDELYCLDLGDYFLFARVEILNLPNKFLFVNNSFSHNNWRCLHIYSVKAALQHDQYLHKNHTTSKNATRPAFCGCKNCALTSFAIIVASLVWIVDINLVVTVTLQTSCVDAIHILHMHSISRVLILLPHSLLHHDPCFLCFQLLGRIFVSV